MQNPCQANDPTYSQLLETSRNLGADTASCKTVIVTEIMTLSEHRRAPTRGCLHPPGSATPLRQSHGSHFSDDSGGADAFPTGRGFSMSVIRPPPRKTVTVPVGCVVDSGSQGVRQRQCLLLIERLHVDKDRFGIGELCYPGSMVPKRPPDRVGRTSVFGTNRYPFFKERLRDYL